MCQIYFQTLQGMRLIEKTIPCGEKETSKKTLYQISDPFFRFWYRFLFRNQSYYELLGEADAAREIMGLLSDYMREIFERICMQYLIRRAKERTLPFIPAHLGKWWVNNPKKKKQDEIDILGLSRTGEEAIFCECKYRNQPFDEKGLKDLFDASEILTQPQKRSYILFSKSGFTSAVKEQAKGKDIELITPKELFQQFST